MTERRGLRAVGKDEKPEPARKRTKTLVSAVNGGDYLEILRAQRLDIAKSLQNPETQGPARAALHRQLGLIAKEIREIEEAAAEEEAEASGPTPDAALDPTAI